MKKPTQPYEWYEIPIEKLGLSVSTINKLKRIGMNSVGDCIDFFERGNNAMINVPFGLIGAMVGEVKVKLIEHGYWIVWDGQPKTKDFSPDTIAELKKALIEKDYWHPDGKG